MYVKETGKARSDCLMEDGMLVVLTGDKFFWPYYEEDIIKEQEQLHKARIYKENIEYKVKLAEWQA